MATEAFVVHSNGPSATVQLLSGDIPVPSILLDAGGDPRMQADNSNNYGHFPLATIQRDMLRRAAIPIIPGLYEPTQPEHPQNLTQLMTLIQATVPSDKDREAIRQGVDWQGKQKVDLKGIYTSHPHFDSNLALPIIRPEIPLLGSKGTLAVLGAIGRVMPMIDRQFTRVRRPDANGKLEYVDRPLQVLFPGQPHHIDGFGSITVNETDHFMGSTSADIETDRGARITFTSDLGPGENTNRVLENIIRNGPETDLLFIDVNNLGNSGEQRTDADLQDELLTTLKAGSKQNLMIQIPRRDLGRLAMISEVAAQAGRRLVLPWQLAAYQQLVAEEAPEAEFNYQDIYLTPRTSATYRPQDYPAVIRDRVFNGSRQVHTPRELAALSTKASLLTVIEDDVQFRHINPRQFLPKEKTKPQALIYAGYQLPRSEQLKLQRMCKNAEMDFTNLETSIHLPSELLMDFLSQLMVRQLVPLHTIKPGTAVDMIKRSGYRGGLVQNVVRNIPYGYNGKKLI